MNGTLARGADRLARSIGPGVRVAFVSLGGVEAVVPPNLVVAGLSPAAPVGEARPFSGQGGRGRLGHDSASVRRRTAFASFVAEALGRGVDVAHRDGAPPHVAGTTGIHLSSGSRDGIAVFALAARPIGIDVERAGRSDEIPWGVLHPTEAAVLRAVAEPGRALAFARIWTAKEAYLKMRGTGLSRAPDEFAVAKVADGEWLVADRGRRVRGRSVLVPGPGDESYVVSLVAGEGGA